MIVTNTALVLGMGGFGGQLGQLLTASGRYTSVVWLDDAAPGAAGPLKNYLDIALGDRCKDAYVGLGDNALRLTWLEKLQRAGYRTPVYVDPAAVVLPSAVLGAGTVALPFAFVGAHASVGQGCILNTGSIVDHDALLGDGVHVAPGGIVKAGAAVEAGSKVDSGAVVRSPWEK